MDNFKNHKWAGTTVKLTPQDKTGTPEDFEGLYERRQKPRRATTSPQPKLKAIENPSLEDRMAEFGLSD
jgi:hypothetical protein